MKVRSKWLLKREGRKRNGGRREGRRETEGSWRYGGNRWLVKGRRRNGRRVWFGGKERRKVARKVGTEKDEKLRISNKRKTKQ